MAILLREKWLEIPWEDRTSRYQWGTYLDLKDYLVDLSTFLDDEENKIEYYSQSGWPSNTRGRLVATIKSLKTKNVFDLPKYSWLRNQTILDYLTSEDYNLFLIGFELLKQQNVL